MSNYTVFDENITLEIDFLKEIIEGKAEFSMKLPANSPKNVVVKLSALQISLEKISIQNSSVVKMINYQYEPLNKQSEFLSKLLPEPLSFDFYMAYINKLEAQNPKNTLPDRISITLQISNENPILEEIPFTLIIRYKRYLDLYF